MSQNECWEGDILDRKQYADYLTNILDATNPPLVINIDSEWGTGKTFFLEKWYNDISKTHMAIFYNAWKNDLNKDPLLALISQILHDLQHHLPKEDRATSSLTNFFKKSGKLASAIAPIIAKGIAKKYIGEDGIEELQNIGSDDENTLAELSEKATQELISIINSNKRTEFDIDNFKKELSKTILDTSKDSNKQLPVYLFIDELDRCRPHFAIETLEKIKHLFDINEIIFIIATDTEQLSHSVGAIYGNGFNSRKYLRRFFDQEYTLPSLNYTEYAVLLLKDFKHSNKLYIHSVSIFGGQDEDVSETKVRYTRLKNECQNSNIILLFSFLAESLGLDIRTQQQCQIQFVTITGNIPVNGKIHDATYLLILLMIKAQFPSLYDHYKRGKVKQNRITIFDEVNINNEIRLRIENQNMSAPQLIKLYAEYSMLSKANIVKARRDSHDPKREPNIMYNILGCVEDFESYFKLIDLANNFQRKDS